MYGVSTTRYIALRVQVLDSHTFLQNLYLSLLVITNAQIPRIHLLRTWTVSLKGASAHSSSDDFNPKSSTLSPTWRFLATRTHVIICAGPQPLWREPGWPPVYEEPVSLPSQGLVWVAVKELKLSYYIGETLLFSIYTHYGNLI